MKASGTMDEAYHNEESVKADETMIYGKVYGEFQDDALYLATVDQMPAMKTWTEREVVDGLSGATIQSKTMGHAVPDRIVLLDGKPVAWADGFGQFWLKLPPGNYILTGKCKGYADASVEVTVTGDSRQYVNFFMKKKH